MNVYVSGAAGFLASHFVEHLLAAGHSILGFDNFVTGRRENLADADRNPDFTFLRFDAGTPWTFTSSVPARFAAPDVIVHAASPASPVDYGNDPLGTMHVNAVGAMEAVSLARRSGARIVFFSTSECYGDPLEHPQVESYWGNVNPVGPRACYDESKRYAEAYVTTAARAYGLDVRIVRIFNTYGPRMQPNDGRVVPNFILAALRGEPLTIYGTGGQTRSFCYVDDLIEGIVRLTFEPGAAGRVINIGNPDEYTINDLAAIIADLAGVPLHVVARSLPTDDPARRRPDIALAREILGWSPKVDLRDGLKRTIDYFRST